jgi:hypothetical protein
MSAIAIDTPRTAVPGSRALWTGRILSGVSILFLTADAAGKLIAPQTMIAYSPPLGLPADPSLYRLIGAILAVCVGLHLWRRTAVLGAVLITGFLGGAIAVNLRAEMPLFSNTLFGLYLGILLWTGFWLRDARVRSLIG